MSIPEENRKASSTDQPAGEMEIVSPGRDAVSNSIINQPQYGGVHFEDDAEVGGPVIGTLNIYVVTVQAERKKKVIAATHDGFKPSCPYPGMKPFRPQDARFSHGREQQIQEMIDRLREQPFLLVTGPSGSGKSSLVFTGILPELGVSEHWDPGFWHVEHMRPGSQPMSSLAEKLGGDLAQPDATLRTLLATHAPAQRLLLVVDQFEEIFTEVGQGESGSDMPEIRRKRQTEFITTLRQLSALDTCAVILTMRIEKPAETVNVEIEERLVERLLADAEDQSGTLPLLQETLRLLWVRMKEHKLTLASYEGSVRTEGTQSPPCVRSAPAMPQPWLSCTIRRSSARFAEHQVAVGTVGVAPTRAPFPSPCYDTESSPAARHMHHRTGKPTRNSQTPSLGNIAA